MKSKIGGMLSILIIFLSACSPAPADISTQAPQAMPHTLGAPEGAAAIPATPTIAPSATEFPTSTPTITASSTPETIKYFVKAGETCAMIALAHDMSLDQLTEFNPGYKCSGIKAGDMLTILAGSLVGQTNANQAQLNPTATVMLQPTKALVATKVFPTATVVIIPTAKPLPTAVAANCSPAYPGVCIPPPPPDLDCKDIPFKRFKVLAPDPHKFDSDKDGIGCES